MKRLLLTCLTVCVAFAVAAPAEAAFQGANGKIAFQSDRDGNLEIYTIDLDGTRTRLTNNGHGCVRRFFGQEVVVRHLGYIRMACSSHKDFVKTLDIFGSNGSNEWLRLAALLRSATVEG